ncbi:MAG: cupin-like domain-containing protein [Parvibaculales bacterium]
MRPDDKSPIGSETEVTNLKIPNSIETKSVDNVGDLIQHIGERKPFIVRGIVSDWPLVKASQKSNDDARRYLLSFYEGRPCGVFRGKPEAGNYVTYTSEMDLNFIETSENLASIFEDMKNSEFDACQSMIYSGSLEVRKHLPGFVDDNPFEFDRNSVRCSIWTGTKTRIPAHSDYTDNFACVAAGQRHFILFPPDQYKNLYLGPMHKTPAGRAISMVDFANPDFEKYPRFSEALSTAYQATLEPGDLIFIPSMWWHHVEGLQKFNILVNYWWHEDGAFLGEPEYALWHALWSIRDLPQDKKDFWKEMFDSYVFNHRPELFEHIPSNAMGIHEKLTPRTGNYLRRYLQTKLVR